MQRQIIWLFHLYVMVDDLDPGDFETSGNFFVDLNRFWITLIPSLSQEYYKKHRFTVTGSLF